MYRFIKCVNGQIFDIKITEFDSLLKYCEFWSFNIHDVAFYFVPKKKKLLDIKFVGIIYIK